MPHPKTKILTCKTFSAHCPGTFLNNIGSSVYSAFAGNAVWKGEQTCFTTYSIVCTGLSYCTGGSITVTIIGNLIDSPFTFALTEGFDKIAGVPVAITIAYTR